MHYVYSQAKGWTQRHTCWTCFKSFGTNSLLCMQHPNSHQRRSLDYLGHASRGGKRGLHFTGSVHCTFQTKFGKFWSSNLQKLMATCWQSRLPKHWGPLENKDRYRASFLSCKMPKFGTLRSLKPERFFFFPSGGASSSPEATALLPLLSSSSSSCFTFSPGSALGPCLTESSA